MDAISKTSNLQRLDLPVSALEPDPNNPNQMTARAFDLLVDNLQRTGLTDPVLVRPLGEGRYRVVGGHHRLEGAKYLGFDTVPCTVITDPEFDEEAATFQMVRMNVIRGKMDPQAFLKLYEKVQAKYAEDVLQDLFGFAERAEFEKLVKQTAKSLPKDMRDKFMEAAKDVKTIDGLARILNEIFTRYGDTVPYAFMVMDYGGQQHVWVQVSKDTMKALRLIGDMCIERERTMDDMLGRVIQAVAKGEFAEFLEQIVAKTPKVVLPANMPVAPTKKNIEAMSVLD